MPLKKPPYDFEYMNHKLNDSNGKGVYENNRCRVRTELDHTHPEYGGVQAPAQCALEAGHMGRHEYHITREKGLVFSWAGRPE